MAVARVIRTARLTLRPLRAGDADAVMREIGNYDVVRWLAAPPYPYAVSDARDFIAAMLSQNTPCWAIEDADGLCGVISIDPDMGYWLARSVWGRGYVTEAGDAVIDAMFGSTRARAITASHFEDNDRSAHALRKLGFVATGRITIRSAPLGQDVPSVAMELTRARWEDRRRYRIVTPRLRLRELRAGDWRDLQRIGGDPRVAPNLLPATVPWAEDDVRRLVAASAFRGRPGFRLTVRRRGRTVGFLGLSRADGNAPPSVFFCFEPRAWGRGFATEAMSAFLRDSIHRFDLDVVEADHFVDNPASGAVLRKLGFRRAGQGMGRSAARLEPAPVVIYRLEGTNREAST